MKVLYLIDDSEIALASLHEALASAGLNLISVPDEAEALRQLKGSAQPDIILTEDSIPIFAGIELFRSTRRMMAVPVAKQLMGSDIVPAKIKDRLFSMRSLFSQTRTPQEDVDFSVGARVALEYWEKVADLMEAPIHLVIRETDQSATDVVGRIKELDDTATQLIHYLTSTDADTHDLQSQIQQNTTFIEHIGQFVQELPAKIETERSGAKKFIDRIETIVALLEGLVETIKTVNRQINMVAINAVIQAAHAGEKGKGFAIVAEEIRRLATHTADAAERVTNEIEKIRLDVRYYHEDAQKRNFNEALTEAAEMAGSVQKIQENYDDMQQYYKTMVTVVKAYNTRLADEIVDTLGSIQYQDVIRQRLERLLAMQHRYRAVLESAMNGEIALSSPEFRHTAEQVLLEYLEQESHHAGGDNDDSAPPKIELF